MFGIDIELIANTDRNEVRSSGKLENSFNLNPTRQGGGLKSILFKSNLENSYNYKISSNGPHICVQ